MHTSLNYKLHRAAWAQAEVPQKSLLTSSWFLMLLHLWIFKVDILNIQTGQGVRASWGSWWVLCTEAGSFLQSSACKCSFWPRFASVPALLTLNLAVYSLLSSLLSQLICVKCRTPGQNNQSDAKAVTQPCVLWKLQGKKKGARFWWGERERKGGTGIRNQLISLIYISATWFTATKSFLTYLGCHLLPKLFNVNFAI